MDNSPERSAPDSNHELRADMRLAQSATARYLYIAAGSVSFALGVIGLLIPGVPTTPFLLLAAFCYARGSERFYFWLMTNKYFGEYLRAWRNNEGLPLKVKIYVIALLWSVSALTAFVVLPLWYVRLVLALVVITITVYIVELPTRRS